MVTSDTPISGSILVLQIYINTNTQRFQYFEEFPKDKLDNDATIKLINNKVQSIYATKFGKFANITKVYKRTDNKVERYYLYYNTEKGLFFVTVLVKNDNTMDVQAVDNWVQKATEKGKQSDNNSQPKI